MMGRGASFLFCFHTAFIYRLDLRECILHWHSPIKQGFKYIKQCLAAECRMPNDITHTAVLSLSGVALYGLYYTWRRNRFRSFCLDQTTPKISEREKVLLKFMLHNDIVFYMDLLEKMKKLIIENYGFDISKDMPLVSHKSNAEEEITRFILEYTAFIKKICKFYNKFISEQHIDCSTFFTDWFRLISNDSALSRHGDSSDFIDVMIQQMGQNCEIKVSEIFSLDLKAKMTSYDSLKRFLKENNLINIEDFDGHGRALQKVYDSVK